MTLVGFRALSLCGIFMTCVAFAQTTAPKTKAVLLEVAPTIDGKINSGEWDKASYIKEFYDRATAKESPDRTEAWLGYTKKGIYLAFYCHDREPDKIIAREIIPNSEFNGEDFVEFDLNAFGNRTFGQLCEFIVNARGTKSENFSGGRTDKREWRGDWKAATSRVPDGWICEIEIPWTILNYPDKESFDMDLNLIRGQGRTLFEQSWANVRLNPLPELQGIWEGVEPPKPPKPKIQFLGYSAPELNRGVFQNRMGLDARYAFSPSVTGVMSFAPDFRNIQDVVPGIDFVRTERFLSESRPFFSEGSGFFRLNGDFTYGTMFYSRRIADFDMATKVYGQATPTLGFGALYTNKFSGEKAVVVNVKKTLSATSSLNIFGTSNADNGQNDSFGFSYSRRTGKIGLDLGASMEKDNGSKADTAGTIGLTYQGNGDYAMARYLWVTPEFNPALGIVPWKDRRGGYLFYENNRQFRKGALRETYFSASASEFRTYDGILQEHGLESELSARFSNNMEIEFSKVRYTYSGSLDDTFSVGLGVNVTNRFKQFRIFAQSGTQNDKPSRFYGLGVNYRLINNLDLSIDKSVQELDGTQRQTIGTLAYQMSPQDLISSRFVMNGDNQNLFFSFRHAGFKGAEYYFIYGDPNAPRTSNRISIKAVWAF